MMRGLGWPHLGKLVLILAMLVVVAVMLNAAPEQYIYGGF